MAFETEISVGFVSGLLAARPAVPAFGQVYSATDTNHWYLCLTAGSWTDMGATGGGTPGGSSAQVQYNNAGAFGGITGATTNGTALTLVAPILGAASATSINKVSLTAPATSATLTIIDGKTLTANKSLTLDGTDSTTHTFPSTNSTVARTDAAQTFTGINTLGTMFAGTWPVSGAYFFIQHSSLAQSNGNQALIQMTDGHTEINSVAAKVLNLTQGSVVQAQLTTAGDFVSGSAGLTSLGNSTTGWKQLFIDQTITAGGTTGNRTINKAAGTVNIAAAGTTATVTNSLCTTSSIVLAVIRTNDSTATLKNVVPGSGSFVITLTAAATAEVSIGFLVINQ